MNSKKKELLSLGGRFRLRLGRLFSMYVEGSPIEREEVAMVRIRIDTAEATRIATQCINEADTLLQQVEQLHTLLTSLSSSWSGRSYNRISPQFDVVVQQGTRVAEQLRALGQDLQKIAMALEIADAGGTAAFLAPLFARLQERFAEWLHFTQSSPAVEVPGAPKNAQELFKSINNMKHPIGIYKIGENEYVVLIQGTQTHGFARNWGSAIQEGLGVSAAYEREVRRLMTQAIPEGATVHLVGHSQGGFAANSIADNQEILSRYHIDSVVTYGAASPTRRTKGVDYRNYAVVGDPVPALDRQRILESTSKQALISALVGPLSALVGPLRIFVSNKIEPYDPSLHMVSGEGKYPIDKHIEGYSTSPELAAESLPFDIKQWELVQTSDARKVDGLSRDFQMYMPVLYPAWEMGRLATYTGISVVEAPIDYLPQSIYPAVDRVRDKINDFIGQL